jgi:hypothetical protein
VKRKQKDAQVFRITGARQGLADDVRGRQRRYVISMLVRTLAVILAVVLWNVERPLAIIALVLGLVLPYVAVVIANAGRENAQDLPSSFVHENRRPALGPGDQDTPAGAEDERRGPQDDSRPAAPPYGHG